MSEQPDLQAIREFLGGLEYHFNSDWHGHHAWFENDEVSITWGGSEGEVLADCLSHYLSTQLGVHWRGIWKLLNDTYSERYWISNWENADIFDTATYDSLKQAIDYLEQLEKGE